MPYAPASRLSLFDARRPGFRYRFLKKVGSVNDHRSDALRSVVGCTRARTRLGSSLTLPQCPILLGCRSIPAPGRPAATPAAGAKQGGAGIHGRIPNSRRISLPHRVYRRPGRSLGRRASPMRSRPAAAFIGRTVPEPCPTALRTRRPFRGPSSSIGTHSAPPDAERLAAMARCRPDDAAWALILCISPYVRYEELERWSGLVGSRRLRGDRG